MKISTWNIMRPNSKSSNRNNIYIDTLNQIDPDILVLTETNSLIDFGNKYFKVTTLPLPNIHDGYPYQSGENRVTIFSKFPFTRKFQTVDSYSSVCAEILTPFGHLIIYGTIIGFLGGRKNPFITDLEKQAQDLTQISSQGHICFTGDLNVSFSGFPYPSRRVRKKMIDLFEGLLLTNLTTTLENSVIHTIISDSFLANKTSEITRVLFDKKITDHNLVTVNLKRTIA
jgi:hypothetical protein